MELIKKPLVEFRKRIRASGFKKQRISMIMSASNIDFCEKKRLEKLVKNGKSVVGYVPYVADQTEVIFFNFFSINYGFRSKGTAIVCMTDQNFNPVQSTAHELDFRTNLAQFPRPPATNPAVFCTILVVHDRMQINHAGHGGNLRFWGSLNNFSALTHSMPVTFQEPLVSYLKRHVVQKKSLYVRRMYPPAAGYVTHYSSHGRVQVITQRGDLSSDMDSRMGFSLLGDEYGKVRACFHDAPYLREAIVGNKSLGHVVALPCIPSIDALLYFGECCKLGARFSVKLFNFNQEDEPVAKTELEIRDFEPVRVSSLFEGEESIGTIPSWITFTAISGQHRSHYINVIYSNKENGQIFDGVHSHSFSDSKSRRALKFAPFKTENSLCLADTKQRSFKSILTIFGDEVNDVRCRVRVFSNLDRNFEALECVLVRARSVQFIDLSKNMALPAGSGYFFAQLESEEQNLAASMFCWSQSDTTLVKSICVDHLTGG